MRVETIIKLLIGVIFLCSCKSENERIAENEFFVIIKEYSRNKLHKTDSTTLTIRKKDSISFLLFGLKSDGEYEILTDFHIEINSNDSSQILVDTKPAELISKKKYIDKNKKVIVKKYYYDIESENDEEGYFFLSDNRLVAFNSTAWNLYKLYRYDNSELDKLLINDTTDFFNYRNKKFME